MNASKPSAPQATSADRRSDQPSAQIPDPAASGPDADRPTAPTPDPVPGTISDTTPAGPEAAAPARPAPLHRPRAAGAGAGAGAGAAAQARRAAALPPPREATATAAGGKARAPAVPPRVPPRTAAAPDVAPRPERGAGGAKAKGKANLLPSAFRVPAAAPRAAARLRHHGILASFVGVVMAPMLAASLYLFTIADDQYTSTVGFSVRSEDMSSALDLLGGLSSLGLSGSGTSSDSDILYQFIQSQELVQRVNEKIDLREIYSRPAFDPVFAFDPDRGIEDLVDYWQDMVRINYDSTTGLIELRVHAFDAEDARTVAQLILDESTRMINDLSAIARADATRYAKEELDKSIQRLRDARVAMTEFRSRTQIVDPTADIKGQMGLLYTLQEQLAAANIDINLLRQTTQPSDPRIAQNERRISVIEQLIQREREKFGMGGGADGKESDYSTMVGEYERLVVDLEFAEKAYIASLTNYDAAIAEAQRMSRYIAAYVRPTLAEKSLYPQRGLLSLLTGGIALLIWSIGLLIYYSVRDRR